MTNLINCGTCGYPLTPEERTSLIEHDGVMVKPAPMTTDRALDLALEAMERYQVKRQDFDRFADEITAIKQARSAPVQEPWKYRRWDDAKKQWELTDDCGWPSEPLYTTPPAQPAPVQEPVAWVGLTDDERVDLWKATETDNRMVLIDAIEAKLKEKNNG